MSRRWILLLCPVMLLLFGTFALHLTLGSSGYEGLGTIFVQSSGSRGHEDKRDILWEKTTSASPNLNRSLYVKFNGDLAAPKLHSPLTYRLPRSSTPYNSTQSAPGERQIKLSEQPKKEPVYPRIYDDFNGPGTSGLENSTVWYTLTPAQRESSSQLIKAISDEGISALQITFPGDLTNHIYGVANATGIGTKELYGYGTYKARFKAAPSRPQENVITGFSSFWNAADEDIANRDENSNGIIDNSEIDFEIHSSYPSTLYMTVFTDYQKDKFSKVTRVMDLSTGHIWQTPSGMEGTYELLELPPLPPVITDYYATNDYYIYGFTWNPDFIRFFIIDKDGKEIELWKYDDKEHIPSHPARMMLNVWHTMDWACINSAPEEFKPLSSDVILRVDWAEYEPSGA